MNDTISLHVTLDFSIIGRYLLKKEIRNFFDKSFKKYHYMEKDGNGSIHISGNTCYFYFHTLDMELYSKVVSFVNMLETKYPIFVIFHSTLTPTFFTYTYKNLISSFMVKNYYAPMLEKRNTILKITDSIQLNDNN